MSVFFYGCITIDGYLADKNHHLEWLYQTGNAEETDYNDFYKMMDITIMGKKTFNEIKHIKNLDRIYSKTTNYVFTHSETLSTHSFLPVSGDVAKFVKEIGKNKNVWVVGGNTILAPLLDRNMIEYMIIQIAPVLLGDGIPLFTQEEALKRFKLIEVKKFGQFAELVYVKQ